MLLLTFCLSAISQQQQSGDAVAGFKKWLLANRDPTYGLPYSHVGDKRFEKWCITYDAAVTALAYVALGEDAEARKIVDFYIDRPEVHRLGGLLEAVLTSSPPIGQEYSVRTGANVWMGIASFHVYRATGDKRYLDFAIQIADFALALQDRDAKSPTFGGIRLGPEGESNFPGDQHLGHDPGQPRFGDIFATEVAIDSFALFNMIAGVTSEPRFTEGRDRARGWLEKVALNRRERRWNRGYFKGLDKAVATDIHAWGISSLGVDALDRLEPGLAEAMVGYVEAHCRTTVDYVRADGKKVRVTGFDFVDDLTAKQFNRPPMVSPEWTFQMANAHKRLAEDFAAKGESQKSGLFRRKRELFVESIVSMAVPMDGALALPYSSLPDAAIGHEYRTPVAGTFSVIGVAYGILALTGYDPLIPPKPRQGAGAPKK